MMKKIIYSMNIVVFSLVFIFSTIGVVKANNERISAEEKFLVSYTTHVQEIGWQDYKHDGETSGTSGQGLRLEGIKMKLNKAPSQFTGDIEYATHIQDIGWQEFVKNDEISGTTGQGLRLEAIKIRLTGEMAGFYNIYYRVHVEELGWLDWAMNGQPAGTSGYGYRLEAIEIKLDHVENSRPENMEIPYKDKGNTTDSKEDMHVSYTTHVQEVGWQKEVSDGKMAGTSGKSYRLEGIKIHLATQYNSYISYRTHVQEIGWQEWKNNGEISGTSGKGLRLEAIEIKLGGEIEAFYDICYRVHVEEIGWQEWKKNGEMAGTSGKGLRLEAIEIKLIKKEKEEIKVVHGIDVSSFNKTINWNEVKNDGIEFAMIRVGYRGYGISSDGIDGKLVEDSTFRYNIEGAIKNNIPVGVYFFSQAKNEEEARQEADFVLERIKNYKITYPVAIDVEYANSSHTGRADNLTKEERTKVILAFFNRIGFNYRHLIYTGKYFAENNLNMEELSYINLWLAHYTGATQDDPLAKPSNYKGKYVMWQYTSTGSTNGIEGNVDRNIYCEPYFNVNT